VVTLGLVAIATCGLAAAHRAQTDSDWRETSPLGHQQRGTAGQPTQSADDIAPSAPPTRWSTGNEFQEALQRTVRITWNDSPLRTSLMNLARDRGVAVFLDRRVDPSNETTFQTEQVPLAEALAALGDSLNAAAVEFGDVMYIGPLDAVADLPYRRSALLKELQSFPPAVRRVWLAESAIEWPELSQPRELMATLVGSIGFEGAGLEARNLEAIPLDLWPAYELPAMSLLDRLLLIVTGFGLELRLTNQGMTVELVPANELEPVVETYSADELGGLTAEALMKSFPDANVTGRSRSLRVIARPVTHYRLRRLLAVRAAEVAPDSASPLASRVVTLNQEASIGAVLREVARMLDVELVYDDELAETLKKRIDIHLTNVTYQQLIEHLLESTDLTFELTASQLKIVPKR